MRVQGVQEDGVLVRERPLVREREREQLPVQVQGRGPVQEPVPTHHHNLWLRWRGSKKSFSSTRQMSFSKLHRRRCANC